MVSRLVCIDFLIKKGYLKDGKSIASDYWGKASFFGILYDRWHRQITTKWEEVYGKYHYRFRFGYCGK